jgi:hypothetical protein
VVDIRHELTKRQRNDLFRVIEGSGIPVLDFELVVERRFVYASPRSDFLLFDGKRPITIIRHAKTMSVFGVIQITRGEFNPRYDTDRPLAEKPLLRYWNREAGDCTWEDILRHAQEWVDRIKSILPNTEAPDLWEEHRRGRDFFRSQHGPDVENSPFTAAEQLEIAAQVHRMRTYLETAPELTSDQTRVINARLDYLQKASERVGRKDWLMMFNGAIASLILSDLLPSQTAQHIIMLAVNGLGHLFGMGGPPMHLPGGG